MSTERNFRQMLEAQWAQGKFVCVGLDSEFEKLPKQFIKYEVSYALESFNRSIVDATHPYVCAYKPNIAFYEAHGIAGLRALQSTIVYIRQVAPDVPVILDAKRADIGNTNNGYVYAIFDELLADAVTVNPYFGREALQPFLDCVDKGIAVLCRTSNPGASEFQSLMVGAEGGLRPLYQVIARHVVQTWNVHGNCMLVVGATCPEELAAVRRIVGDMPILIPGTGAQGGDVRATVEAGQDSRGRGMVFNASRSIIFASSGEDFADAACHETLELNALINQYRYRGEGIQ